MSAWRIALVVIVASFIASMTDWLFNGLLFHARYLINPEVWRVGVGEGTKILYSEIGGVLACLGFAVLAAALRLSTMRSLLTAAILVWAAATVPVIIDYGIWVKIDPLVLSSQAIGWLVRLLITAVLLRILAGMGTAAHQA